MNPSHRLEDARRAAAQRLPAEGLIERLLDDGERARLLADARSDRTLSLANRLHDLLPRCTAAPDQIRRLISALPADGSQDQRFEGLLDNPATPEELLFELLAQGRFISALGHRRGPRRLLELLAEQHGYAEAITTLALDHYGRDDHPLADFVTFVRRHRGCAMMSGNLRATSRLSAERQRAAIAALDEPAPEPEPAPDPEPEPDTAGA